MQACASGTTCGAGICCVQGALRTPQAYLPKSDTQGTSIVHAGLHQVTLGGAGSAAPKKLHAPASQNSTQSWFPPAGVFHCGVPAKRVILMVQL